MLLDNTFYFSDNQDLSSKTSGTQTQSDNVVDLTGGTANKDGFSWLDSGSIGPSFGEGRMLHWWVMIGGSSAMSAGASTVLLAELFVHSASTSIKSGKSLAQLELPNDAAVGTRVSVGVPYNKVGSTQRYLGVVYKSVGGTITATRVESGFSWGPPDTQLVAADDS